MGRLLYAGEKGLNQVRTLPSRHWIPNPPSSNCSPPLTKKTGTKRVSVLIRTQNKQTSKTDPEARKQGIDWQRLEGRGKEGEGSSQGTGSCGPGTRTTGWGLTVGGRRGWQGNREQGSGGGEVDWDNYNTTTTKFFFKEHEFPVICEWEYLLSHKTQVRLQWGKP